MGSVEHWYGVPEALFEDKTIQDFSAGYDYNNEYDRFSEAGELWAQAADPGSEKWIEVIRAAKMDEAELLAEENNEPVKIGEIRPGMLADLVLIDENPLHNLKYLYGTGAVKLNQEKGEVERIGGIQYTIKDGIVYDAKKLLDDVEEMVEKEKGETDNSKDEKNAIKRPSNDKALNIAVDSDPVSGHKIPISTWIWMLLPLMLIIILSIIGLFRRREE